MDEFLLTGGLSKDDVCFAGSFAMHVLNIKIAGDIDLCGKSEDRHRLKELGLLHNGCDEENESEVFVHFVKEEGGFIALLLAVGITESEIVTEEKFYFYNEGYKVLRPEINYAEKLYRCTKLSQIRPKDFKSIEIIKNQLINQQHPDYVWSKKLVLFPRNRLDKIKVAVTHPLFKFLFLFGPIRRNWSYVGKFFWSLEYEGISATIKSMYKWYKK